MQYELRSAFVAIAVFAVSVTALLQFGLTATILLALGCLFGLIAYRTQQLWCRVLALIACCLLVWSGSVDLVIVRGRVAGGKVESYSKIRFFGTVFWESRNLPKEDFELLDELKLQGLMLPNRAYQIHPGIVDLT